MAVSESALKR